MSVESHRKDQKKWSGLNPAYRREWDKLHPEKVKEYWTKSNKSHPFKWSKWRKKVKIQVLTYYGKDKELKCALCGEDRLGCLTIDHINGGGHQHRKNLGIKGGVLFYRWLIKNNFPEGYRTLCMNCQFLEREKHKEENNNEIGLSTEKIGAVETEAKGQK